MFNWTYFSPICDNYNHTQEWFMKQSILKIWRNFGYFWQKKQKKYIAIKWKELSEIFQNLPFWHRGRVYFMKIIVPCHYNFFSLGPSSGEVWTYIVYFDTRFIWKPKQYLLWPSFLRFDGLICYFITLKSIHA